MNQLVTLDPILDWVSLVELLLGLVVTVQAYRGYRRTRRRSILYLTIGLVCLLVLPPVTIFSISYTLSPPGPLSETGLIRLTTFAGQILRTTGLCCILYSLYCRE